MTCLRLHGASVKPAALEKCANQHEAVNTDCSDRDADACGCVHASLKPHSRFVA